MAAAEVDAVLARLVAQFGSPYDFLRELAQNAMDAGSDRVEVTLERHAVERSVVFELVVADTGSGMDETIIDGAFTRLFSSTKTDDRTMAGGFGVGFVSVFAWEPEAVLVQTGRAGEAWELVFYPDRTFEKHRVDGPCEGTTITLLKRAPANEYEATAEAIRDSLWRWCRFCPLEVTFEDLADDEGPELIQDAPTTAGAVCAVASDERDEQIRVAFAVPPRAVLLRRGLILEETTPGRAFASLPSGTAEHVQVWADSSDLVTTLARDGAVADAGRRGVEARVLEAVARLRKAALDELERLARADAWTRADAGRYGALQAHLSLETGELGAGWEDRSLIRLHGPDLRACSVADLTRRLRGRPLLWAEHDERGPALARAAEAGLPVLTVEGEPDTDWLGRLAERVGGRCRSARTMVVEAGTRTEDERARALESDLARLLGSAEVAIEIEVCDGLGDDDDPPLIAEGLSSRAGERLALVGDDGLGDDARRLWLNRRHLLVQAALRMHPTRVRPEVTAALAVAVAARRRVGPNPETLRQRWEALIEHVRRPG